jgi:ferrochelatase
MNAETPLAAARATGPLPAGHPVVKPKKVGVLLVNLGTPDGTEFKPMRRYLREFLSDPRVIEIPRWKWYPILYGIVLNTRPSKSGKAYASIWNRELNESPLRTFTRAQGEKLAARMLGDAEVVVDWAMPSPSGPMCCRPRVATASSSSRSIRNIPRRPRRR